MPHCDAYVYCHGNCDSNSNGNDDAEANAHGKTASNTCASAVIAGSKWIGFGGRCVG